LGAGSPKAKFTAPSGGLILGRGPFLLRIAGIFHRARVHMTAKLSPARTGKRVEILFDQHDRSVPRLGAGTEIRRARCS